MHWSFNVLYIPSIVEAILHLYHAKHIHTVHFVFIKIPMKKYFYVVTSPSDLSWCRHYNSYNAWAPYFSHSIRLLIAHWMESRWSRRYSRFRKETSEKVTKDLTIRYNAMFVLEWLNFQYSSLDACQLFGQTLGKNLKTHNCVPLFADVLYRKKCWYCF